MKELFLKRVALTISISALLLVASFSSARSGINRQAAQGMSQHQDSAKLLAQLSPNSEWPAQAQARQISWAERIACQYAIEEVYWRHRIWPKENPGRKPSLDAMMSAAQIEKKVEDYLRNSRLLADYWRQPITPEQLQAEMERMASQTKQSEVLQELFAALGNDPFIIAECLARPVLSERLVKQLYAHDERSHGELKRRAESELRVIRSVEEMKRASGTYSEMEWIRSEDDRSSDQRDNGIVGHAHRLPTQQSAAPKAFGAALQRHDAATAIRVTKNEWDEITRKLAAQFGHTVTGRAQPQLAGRGESALLPIRSPIAIESITAGVLGALQEDDTSYYAMAVLEKGKDRLKVATVSWLKEPFESWAAKEQIRLSETTDEPAGDYTLPVIANSSTANPAAGCTDNSWVSTYASYYPGARSNHTAVWTGSEMIIWDGFITGSFTSIGDRYNPSTDTWTPASSNNAPDRRHLHTAVWTGNEMIVWGGYSLVALNTGGRYDPSTDSWIATSTTNAPAARVYHSAVWTGNQMIIWGGSNGSNDLNTGGRYDPVTNSWVATTTTNAASMRSSHTAIWTGTEMIVWGGQLNGVSPYLDTGAKYNPGADSWVAVSTTSGPPGRYGHTAVWTGREMIIWGGRGLSSYLDSGGRYNPSTNSWTATSTINVPAARASHTAVWTGSEMLIWGGDIGAPLDTGGRYNPSTNNWVATATANSPAARSSHTAVWTGGEMIIWGGYNGSIGNLNTGSRYNPITDSWVATNAHPVPAPRRYHTSVWTGSEMIVWGGSNYLNSLPNSGGQYSPSTDNWTETTTVNAPEAREYHAAIWTGTEMIIWGGMNHDEDDVNSGGRYMPNTNDWVATTTTNAPAGRRYHTAVWTGSEMIVWGGSQGDSYLNTGGRYNPSTDMWVATTTSNAPIARTIHTGVWSGNDMIIWGGYPYTNSGGRYNPSTDSWVATASTNAPSARNSHTAVWTGSEMIIWGGYSSGTFYTNSGGRYNPSADSWGATTTTNAPSARYRHTAVWAGSEMIVWGGYSSGTFYTNSGGRYNPSADSWVATTTTNAPSARYEHTAVWTGGEMIVWGGENDDFLLNTGGRYCAQSAAPVAQSAVSRKIHGLSGAFDVNLPLTGTQGIECRAGGATSDYSVVVTFANAVAVNGSPQAQVISGIGTVGSGGVSNGGMVTISSNTVSVPLTNVVNAQTINVRLNGVTGSSGSSNITVAMSILVSDTNANGAVNSADVAQTKARLGQTLDATNFRSDVNANGAINAGDVSQIKSLLGTGLP